jgi:predicted Zn-dependent protease
MRRHKEQSPEAKQVKAEQLIGEIYERIERKQLTEAYRIYYLNKPLLSQFAYPEAYVSMRKTLVKAYSKEMNL